MGATAILFPGQGSQTPDMRELVAARAPRPARAVIAVVGEDPFPRAEDGTNFAQPAIFCASLAGWEALGRPQGEFMAGHSLGELGALVAAGRLAERDGLELVALRGRLMQESGARAGNGGMLALIGAGAAEHAPELAWRHGLVDRQRQRAPAGRAVRPARGHPGRRRGGQGARACGPASSPSRGAFHSPMMAEAVPAFRAALDAVEVSAGDGRPCSARSPPSRSTTSARSSPTR